MSGPYAHVFCRNDDETGEVLAEALGRAGYTVEREPTDLATPEVTINRQTYRGEGWMEDLRDLHEAGFSGRVLGRYMDATLDT